MKAVIVTGASGFIGQKLVKELLDNNYFVYGIDIKDFSVYSANYIHIKSNLSDYEHIMNSIKEKIEFMFHLAWIGISDDKRSDLGVQLENIKISFKLVELSKKMGVSKFIFCGGSIMEYECYENRFDNTILDNINNLYGFSKLYSHMTTMLLARNLNIRYNAAMITNIYGPNEKSNRLINNMLKSLYNNEKVELSSCTQEYDFIYIDDAVRAIRFIAEKGEDFKEYYVGSNEKKYLKDYVNEIGKVLSKQSLIFFNSEKKGVHLDYSIFDRYSIYKLGFKTNTNFKMGIINTYKSMVNYEK